MVHQAIAQPLARCPVEVGMFPHWLAIDGRQPAIPENAPVERRKPAARRARPAATAEAAGAACASPHTCAGALQAPTAGPVHCCSSSSSLGGLSRMTCADRGRSERCGRSQGGRRAAAGGWAGAAGPGAAAAAAGGQCGGARAVAGAAALPGQGQAPAAGCACTPRACSPCAAGPGPHTCRALLWDSACCRS